MFDPPPVVTQPGGTLATGGDTVPTTGSVPRLVWFPFKRPLFYVTALRQVSRQNVRFIKDTSHIRVRGKTVSPALGNGVWSVFSNER